MKKFLMTAVLGMFALAGFSQVKWDARLGVNFSNLTGDGDTIYFGCRYGLWIQ